MKKGVNFLLLSLVIVLVTFVPIAIAKNAENSNDEATLLKSFSQFQAPLVAILSIVSDLFENLISDISLPGIISKKIGFPITGAAVSLPQAFVDTTMPVQTGQTWTVNAGGNLQQAINNAQPGDTIVLQAGATFTGNFVVPFKSNPNNKWIIMTTSAANNLPPQGQRANPSIHAQYMPKIVSPNLSPALAVEGSVNGWRFVGIEITTTHSTTNGINYNVVWLESGSSTGSSNQNLVSEIPSNIIFDRVYIHGTPTGNVNRGILMESSNTAVIDSYFADFHSAGTEAQTIATNNGPGPYLIDNNYLEAAGEVVIFGGADPKVSGLIPSDIVVKRNHLTRPMSWQSMSWTVKNIFELKNAQRVLVEGNVMENHWVDAQAGSSIVVGTVNQNGNCPWCIVQDVTFQNNHINNVAAGFNVFPGCGTVGGSYQCGSNVVLPTRRVSITNNLFTNVGGANLGATGSAARVFLLQEDVHDLLVERNTGFAPYSFLTLGACTSPDKQNFIFRNNIGGNSQYNWFSSAGQGDTANANCLTQPYITSPNGFVHSGASSLLPTGSITVSSMSATGIVNPVWPGGNWSLTSSSPFAGMGVDWNQLRTATIGSTTGMWGACTDTTWTPATNTRCGTFTQVSNCGNTRTATGTLTCGGATPFCGSSNVCVQCTQNSQCSSGQVCTNNACVSSAPVPTGSLLLAYNFSEGTGTTTADYSGNSRTGTLNGTTWTTGKTGSGLSFNGILANVVTPDFNPPSSITMQAWIYPTNFSNKDRFVFSKGITEYEFRIIGSSGLLQASFGGANIRDYGTDFSNSANLNKWHHYAYTYDATTGEIKLYKDGVLSNSSSKPNSIPANTGNNLYIGRHPTFTGESFQGIIDDVRIYNYSRTQAEIIQEMNGTVIISPPCVDSTWAPSEIGLCGSVAQVSNCGNTRVVSGSVQCTTGQTCQGNLCVNTNGTTPGNGTNNTTPPTTGGSGGSGGGGGGGSFPIRTSKTPIVVDTQTLQQASPTTTNVLSGFDPDTGIKQIEVNVLHETEDISIVISQYEDVPQVVSVQKTGKIYKYLQIETQNLENNLDNAIVTFQVEKIWVDGNRLDTDDISLFKFDETEKEWEELSTDFILQDETYYYYQTTLESFSYFLIGQRDTGLGEVGAKLMIVFIVLAIILVWVVFVAITRSKKHAQLAKMATQS